MPEPKLYVFPLHRVCLRQAVPDAPRPAGKVEDGCGGRHEAVQCQSAAITGPGERSGGGAESR